MRYVLLFAVLLLYASAIGSFPNLLNADDEPTSEPTGSKTWQGTWSNRKYNTSGPLKCTATRKDDSSAEARFEGTFMGDAFGYDVTVATKQEKTRTLVEGSAQLDGDSYEWSGFVRGKVFYGQFRSQKGNNGEFRLTELDP